MALTSGAKLGPYEIQSPLGAGGMGEVYRATDTKLGRDVALKVLPAEMAHDPERLSRFRREAKALAQLDHPNIVTIYSVEESEGVHFLTMQLVEGLPLDRLIPERGLSVEQIVDIAGSLADALASAHEKGIVHRDLKPANVMVSNDGRVKILDFGLAKDIRGANPADATMTSDSHTQIGVVMGTPAYMSPEQTSGRPLDHRTDIFSMGVVLHEMATGRRPFEGSSSAELVSAILRDTPSSITDMRPDLPGDLARIVRRCLEKDPRHRLQTARDVNNEFRDLARLISSHIPVPNSISRAAARPDSGASRADEGFWIAVLPFKFKGVEPGLEALAEGITEEIITGMSRFPYLRVIAQGSTLGYAHRAVDLRQVGKELGARYVMEGSLRQSGSRLRIAAQLVDATNGVQLWAESYDRPFQPEEMFELQDDVVPKIVSTIGDTQGILAQSMSEAVWHKATEQLTPYEAVLRSFSYMRRVNSPNHAAARDALERAVEQAPSNGLAWAMLAIIFREEYNHGFNLRPDPLGRAFDAARHAVEAEPSNYLAHHALASVHFFRRELQAFQSEANRALQLNPMDGFTFGYLGMLTAFAGDWDRGCSMSERARSVNPHHPGWYWFAPLFDAFRKQEYRLVLEFAQKVNMPSFWRTNIALAATYGHLGELDAARKAMQMLIAGRPEFAASAQEECNKWWTPDLANQIMEGLHKAGLDSPDAGVPSSLSSGKAPVRSASGESRVEEGFWVAVLPFKYTGSNEDLKALAEGLSEEIVTGLSRFSYLRVIARGSTLRYANQASDLRSVGKELGARYVMEGSLRQAGSKLRLAVQLVDAVSGAHLWAETYERTFKAEDIFSVQDDLVPRIVATVADQHGVLPHSMSSLIRNKSDEQLSPYEAVLRVFSLHERMSPEEHAIVRTLLERTVEKVSGEGNCWAMLATLYCDEYMFGFPGQPDPLGRAQVAAQRAIEIEPSNWLASQAVAQSLFFRKQWQAFRPVAERTIALNRMDGAACAFMGFLLALSGEWERGCELADAARQLNPHHPGWYWLPAVLNAYREHDYLGSVDAAMRINMPGYFWGPLTSAAAYGQLGDHALAQKALRELLAIRPDFATAAREEFGKWFDDELAEHYLEGIRKAGLENTDEQSSTVAKPTAETTGKAGSANPSIAVLPFANMSADQDQEYFSDGLAEEIINSLAQMPGLKVIARTSSFAFRGKEQDIREIAETLNVTHILEGSIRRAGNHIRVTAQLIAAADGSHLWSERYDRELSDIFAVQDEISAAIAAALRVKLARATMPARYVPKLAAYEAYLKARYLQAKVNPESMELAKQSFELAIELDPAFAMAHVGMGFYWLTLTHFGRYSAHHCVASAHAAVWRALQIDSSLPDAHALLGYLAALYEMDWATAERHFDFPMAKEAGFALIRPMYSGFQFLRGNVEQAIKLAQHAIEQDPLEVWARMNLHAYLQAAGRDTEALEQLKKVLELDENQVVALVSMAMLLADRGELAEALVVARRAHAIGPWFQDTIGVLAALLRRNGEATESQSLAQTLGSGESPDDARAHAVFHLLCSDLDHGADWVEKAIEQRDPSMMFYLRFVVCKGLRASHRWPKIAKMINLPAIK